MTVQQSGRATLSTSKAGCLLALAALAALLHVLDADAQIHKCRRPDGRTDYSDQPCERSGGTTIGEVRAPAAPARADVRPNERALPVPPELEANCRKLQLAIDETVYRVRKAQLDKRERMAEAATMQPPLSAQDRFVLERHLDEAIGAHRIYLRGLVHSPDRAQCDRAGIRLDLEQADRLKAQPAG